MEVELDQKIIFCMSLRGKTFQDGKNKWSIRGLDFCNEYNQVTAIVSKVNKTGVSTKESIQSLSEIFALSSKEPWFTETANEYVRNINEEISNTQTRTAKTMNLVGNNASAVPKRPLSSSDLEYNAQIFSSNMDMEDSNISTEKLKMSGQENFTSESIQDCQQHPAEVVVVDGDGGDHHDNEEHQQRRRRCTKAGFTIGEYAEEHGVGTTAAAAAVAAGVAAVERWNCSIGGGGATHGGFTFSKSFCSSATSTFLPGGSKKGGRGRPRGSLNKKGTAGERTAAEEADDEEQDELEAGTQQQRHIFADEKGEIFQQETQSKGVGANEKIPKGDQSWTDWRSQKRIPDSNLVAGTARETLLIDIPWKQLALNALGKPVDIVPPRSIRLLFLAFNHVFKKIIENPRDELGYKMFAILPSILFIDPGKNFNANLVAKVQLILADDYSQFAIGTFPGRYKDEAVHFTTETEGSEGDKESDIRQKLFSTWKFIQKGEVGRAWRAWNSEKASTAATEEGLKTLSEKIIDQQDEYMQREMSDEEVDPVTATAERVQEAISRLASGVRCGHDNFAADILKMMLSFSTRRGADPIVGDFLVSYAAVLNNIFLQPVCPSQVTEFFDGGEIFGLTTLKKANRPITMVSTHRKIADKIILANIQNKLPAIFGGIQYGVGCSFGLEKLVHFVRLGHELHPGHDCANSDFTNAFSTISRERIISETHTLLPEISASTITRLQSSNGLWYNGLESGPAIITATAGVPQGAPKSPFDFAIGTLALGRECDFLAGEEGNSKSFLDDNYTIGESKDVQAVMTRQFTGGKENGLVLNMKKEIVKLGVTGSAEKAEALKRSYVAGWGIDPENIFKHPEDCPNEMDKWGAITMGIPIGSPEYVTRALGDAEGSPLILLNKDFDSLILLAAREPQLAFLFLRMVFAGKLTHFLRGLLPVDSRRLAELFSARQREVLLVILDVSHISDESSALAALGLQQGGAGLCHPLDIINPAFIASIISSLDELQRAYPDIREIIADGQSSLPTIQALHKAVADLAEFDKQVSVKNLLKLDNRQIPKLQHILYRKVREGRKSQFLNPIQSDNEAMAIVGSGSTSFGSAWVEAVPKAAAFTMSSPEFRTAMRNRLLIPHPQIVPNSQCPCKQHPMLDVRGIHLQKCKRLHRETIKTHDILNEDLIQWHKSMGLLAYKIQEDHFRILDPECGLRGDQIVHRAGQMPLLIDLTVSNVITPDLKNKIGKPTTGGKALSREVSKASKYQDTCHKIGQSFLPIVFESQGLAGNMFLQHFDKLINRRADEIGAPVAPLKIYWSRRLSLTLQRSVAQAINIRMASLYAGPAGPTAADESAWPGVVAGQTHASTGNSAWER